eukprot:5956943-Amphidinium_carterae.1
MAQACSYIGEALQLDGRTIAGTASLTACGGRLQGLILAQGRAVALESIGGFHPADQLGQDEPLGRLRVEPIQDEEILQRQQELQQFVGSSAHHANLTARGHGRRLTVIPDRKYVEVLVVNDHRRYTAFGGPSGVQAMAQHTADILSMVNAFYHTPITDAEFPYEIVVVLVGQHTFIDEDPWESSVKLVGAETDFQDLLNRFLTWGFQQQAAGNVIAHDNRVLLSGRNFLSSVVGLAGLSAMCKQTLS